MNLTSGIFRAPRDGTYFFSFVGWARFPVSSSRLYFRVSMYLNGNFVGSGYADEISTESQYETLSLQSTVSLLTGDQIWLQVTDMSAGAYLCDSSSSHYNHFSGWLLEEIISQSLKIQKDLIRI